MQFTSIGKVAVITALTAFSLLFTSNAALADYITSEGAGGNYRYELWSDGNNNYYLKVWHKEASSNTAPYAITRYFSSSRDALNHFDSHYGE